MFMKPASNISQTASASIHHDLEFVDVGEISDLYKNHADCQAVHDIYELGNESAAEKNDPLFDNRVGFTNCDELKGDVTQATGEGLNNASPTPPAGAKAHLRDVKQENRKLDSSERTNDSTVDPNKPKRDILKGFHGG